MNLSPRRVQIQQTRSMMSPAVPTPFSSSSTIYSGLRGEPFKNVLTTILKRSKLRDEIIETLLDDEGMALYNTAFTHPSANIHDNYEYLEFLGDSMVNTAIVWYIARRFGNLQGINGVKVLARLKINLVSKKSFAECAQRLRLWDYISCADNIRRTSKRKALEDVFEAFFGATTVLMDNKVCASSGYSVVYSIVASLFDELDISLKYEDLFDARTRIKEIFDCNKHLGEIEYTITKDPSTNVFTSIVTMKPKEDGRHPVFLGKGTGNTKVDSIQASSEMAIHTLRTMGVHAKVKPEYQT